MDLSEVLEHGRLLAIGAHPDDLTLGVSSVLRRAKDAYTLVVTSGARRSDAPQLADARRAEEIAAMNVLGIESHRLDFLGVTDQETHCHLDEVIAALEIRMRRLLPDAVLTHDYEQGHPDHDASAFASAVAAGRAGIPCYAYPLYNWQDGTVQFCQFREASPDQQAILLSNQELAIKFRALASYVTQMQVIKDFSFHHECVRRLDFGSCDWRKTEESAYEHFPNFGVEPAEVLGEISGWLDAHPDFRE